MKALAEVVVALALLFGAYMAWNWWEVRQLTAFCAAATPGRPFGSLPSLAQTYGIKPRRIRQGIWNAPRSDFITFVPAITTMGDVVCTIEHDKSVVIRAQMHGG